MTEENKPGTWIDEKGFGRIFRFSKYDIKDWGLLVSVTCYVSGFLINTIFLAKFNIISLDLLRVRYLIIGLLFITFLGLVLIPLIISNLIAERLIKTPNLIYLITIVISIIIVYLFTLSLAGSISFPITTPQPKISEINYTLDIFNPNSENKGLVILTIGISSVYLLVVLSFFILSFFILRRRVNGYNNWTLKKSFSWTVNDIKIPLQDIFTTIFYTYLLYVMYIGVRASINHFQRYPIENQSSWILIKYIIFAFLLCVFICLLLFVIYYHNFIGTAKFIRVLMFIFGLSLFVGMLFPAYSFGLYPYIPAQMGGGKPIQVEITSSNPHLKNQLSNQDNDTYILDQTNNGSILIIFNRKSNEQTILEIPTSQIDSITYFQSK